MDRVFIVFQHEGEGHDRDAQPARHFEMLAGQRSPVADVVSSVVSWILTRLFFN
jgi:hypothetical protein